MKKEEDGFGKMVEQMWNSFQEQKKLEPPIREKTKKLVNKELDKELDRLTKLLPFYVKEGDLDSLKSAIDKGADYKKSKETGNNLLLLGLEHKRVKIVKYLMETFEFEEFYPIKEYSEINFIISALRYGDIDFINYLHQNQKDFLTKVCKYFSCKNLGELFVLFDSGSTSYGGNCFFKFICSKSELKQMILDSNNTYSYRPMFGYGFVEMLSKDEQFNKELLDFYEKYINKFKENKEELKRVLLKNILMCSNEEKFLWILKERPQLFKTYEEKRLWKNVLNFYDHQARLISNLSKCALINIEPTFGKKKLGSYKEDFEKVFKSTTLVEALIILENYKVALMLLERSDYFKNNLIENLNNCKNELNLDHRIVSIFGLLNDVSMCKKLLSIIDFNSIELSGGENLLHLCCKLPNHLRKNEIALVLSKSNKDWIRQRNAGGKTPIELGRVQMLKDKVSDKVDGAQERFWTELEKRAISVETKKSKPNANTKRESKIKFL